MPTTEPLAIDRTWMPMSIGAALMESDFTRAALYDEMEQRCGFRPDAGWERIAPVVPSTGDRGRLHLPRGQAAFSLERTSTAKGQIVEWRTTMIRGDRYRFVSQFHAGSAPTLSAGYPN